MKATLNLIPVSKQLPDFHDTTISHVVVARLSSGRTVPAYCQKKEWYDAIENKQLINPGVTHWCDFPITK